MATKQDLTKQKYLLLSVIHLNGFEMSPEMAELVFSRWRKSLIKLALQLYLTQNLAPVMGERPASARAVGKMYDKILNQVNTSNVRHSGNQLIVGSLWMILRPKHPRVRRVSKQHRNSTLPRRSALLVPRKAPSLPVRLAQK